MDNIQGIRVPPHFQYKSANGQPAPELTDTTAKGRYTVTAMTFLDTIVKNRQLFLNYNQAKFDRFQQMMTSTAVRRVINSIPFFLSVNEKRIPGYVEGQVPCGIVNYSPDTDTRRFIQGKFHLQKVEVSHGRPFIEMLAVMGSIGTIAYNKKSDFDYWVCVDKGSVSPEMLAAFQKKIDAVQQWVIREIKTDVHLFINDIDSVKNNIYAEDDEEAFGSTSGAVLKDEFYRSSIIVAGKIPFWWVVPRHTHNAEYMQMINSLPDEMRQFHFVDLGNLQSITKEDFLGAALFQIIKSLGNPFKSILKIGVLEKYLFSHNSLPLLSQKVKSSIHREKITNTILDSYILMFEAVYDYYESILEDRKLLKILRQNLYLKIDPRLSKYAAMKEKGRLPYKVSIMFTYTQEWGWSAAEIKDLDSFENWDYSRIMDYWNRVQKFMLMTYQNIYRQFPKMNLQDRISESDFKLLSRKIKSHFSSSADKIDDYVTFKDTPSESILYMEPLEKIPGQYEWRLFKRDTESGRTACTSTLKIEKSLIKLIAWTSINQIFDPSFSRLKVESGYSRIDQNLVQEMLTQISGLFTGSGTRLRNEYFLNQAFTMQNMLILNFNIEHADQIKTIHHIYRTSWGEAYINEYNSEEDIIPLLERVLRDGLKLRRDFDSTCAIVSPEPYSKIYRSIEKLFREAYDFMVLDRTGRPKRLVTRVGMQYVSFYREKEKVSSVSFPDLIRMLTTITLKPKKLVMNRFFGEDSRMTILEDIMRTRKENSLSIVFEEREKYVLVYLANEKGNLFTFIQQRDLEEQFLVSIYRLCKNTVSRINTFKSVPDINQNIRLSRLQIDRFSRHTFSDETKKIENLIFLQYREKRGLAVSVTRHSQDSTQYVFTYPDRSTSGYIPLSGIQSTVGPVLQGLGMSTSFVDEIQFTDLTFEELSMGSTLYFLEKYRLEYLIGKKGHPG